MCCCQYSEHSDWHNHWHNPWPVTMFSEEDEQGSDFEGFYMSSERKMMSELLTHAKNMPKEFLTSIMKLQLFIP